MKMRKKRSSAVYLIPISLLILSGCSKVPCQGYKTDPGDPSTQIAGEINISIDGSGSMKGFANISDTTFQKTLEALDTALGVTSALGMAQSKTNVLRIGKEGEPSLKPSRVRVNSVLAARKPEFFDENKGKWPKVSSKLETFVSKDANSVDILVSDLEPDDASIKQLISAIKPKLEYSGQSSRWLPWSKRAVSRNELAVIGIKSNFSGGVFPVVAGDFKSFPYNGTRPFYIMAIGPVDKVEKIVEGIASNRELSKDVQVTRFASNPDSGRTSFVDLAQTSLMPSNCLAPVFALSQGLSGKVKVQDASRWLLVQRVRGCSTQTVGVRFAGKPIVGMKGLSYEGADLFVGTGAVVKEGSINDRGVSVEAQLHSGQGLINMVDISVDAYELDQLMWKDWNTSGTQPDGAKTQRLLALLQSIRGETNQYATKEYGNKYSPVRMCAAMKT
jgi:hypothetical protein